MAYSLIPIFISGGYSLYISYKRCFPVYKIKRFVIGLLTIGISVLFFYNSAIETHDYLRVCHHLWHVFISIGYSIVYSSRDR